MVCGYGRPLCVKHRSTNDSVVGRGAINDQEIDLLSELLRVRPNSYWRGDGSYEEDLGATESSVNPHLLECRVVEDITELPLSTRTRCVLKFVIDKLITKASSWGWCSHLALTSVKLMAGLSILVVLGGVNIII